MPNQVNKKGWSWKTILFCLFWYVR